MSRRIVRPRVEVCQLCDFMIARASIRQQTFRTQNILSRSRQVSSSRLYAQNVQSPLSKVAGISKTEAVQPPDNDGKRQVVIAHATPAELEAIFRNLKATSQTLLSLERAPTDKETVQLFMGLNSLAKALVYEPPPEPAEKKGKITSGLLSLGESSSKRVLRQKIPPNLQHIIDEVSELSYTIFKHPPVFITPEVLATYVAIQSTLGKPRTFPEAFELYPSKPLPEEGSSPIKYAKQNPDKSSNAIPQAVADRALQTAIDAKQLVLAMDIIETSYTTKAFHRAKFIKKALLPITGMTVMPFAAYSVASTLSLWQTTMEPQMATNVAFFGILAYIGFTGTIGVVAVTTANDQMDRVTWAQGTPLRERWIREEERAAIDRVAGAWGFREKWRRGEEEGEDWEALKEWIGRRGMRLDSVELMEGME